MPFLNPSSKPRVFAHRGLALNSDGTPLDENSLESFARALEVGTDYIESDIQVSSDGVPVLFHDNDLRRVAGIDSPVHRHTIEELKSFKLEHGSTIPTLREALERFPTARFNLDFKSVASIIAGTREIAAIGAQGRILVASFSDARREAAVSKLPGVATSAGSASVLRALIGSKLHLGIVTGIALANIDAIQVPTHFGRIRLDTERFISDVAKAGTETHFWTINEPSEMVRLVSLGAKGIVTDRADLAVSALH